MPVLPSYKNQSTGLHYKPIDCFLYDSSIAVDGTSNLELYVSHYTFISNARLKLVKANQHHEAKLSLFENYFLPSYMLLAKNDMKYSKNKTIYKKQGTKNKCVCFDDII